MSKKKKDINYLQEGQLFGKLRVLERLEDITKPNGWTVDRYLVMCSCGCCFPTTGPTLVSGFLKQCNYCAGKWSR